MRRARTRLAIVAATIFALCAGAPVTYADQSEPTSTPYRVLLVDEATDAPVSGICVHLRGSETGFDATHCSGDDGLVDFGVVDFGTYSLTLTDVQRSTGPYVMGGYSRLGFSIAFVERTPRQIPLVRGGIITGRVTDRATGEPLQGIRVRAGQDRDVFTDAEGRYLVHVEARATRVGFLRAGAHTDYASMWYPGAHYWAAGTVSVAAGETVVGIDASLVRGSGITGVVRDAVGAPVEGACVFPYPSDWPYLYVLGPDELEVSRCTDAAGRYTLTALLPGSYQVLFRIGEGYIPTDWVWYGGTYEWLEAADVAVDPYDITSGVDLVVPSASGDTGSPEPTPSPSPAPAPDPEPVVPTIGGTTWRNGPGPVVIKGVVAPDTPVELWADGVKVADGTSQADGAYVFRHPISAPTTFVVKADGLTSDERRITVKVATLMRLVSNAPGTVNVWLRTNPQRPGLEVRVWRYFADGSRRRIGTMTTNGNGVASRAFRAPAGEDITVKAFVIGSQVGLVNGMTNPKPIRIER